MSTSILAELASYSAQNIFFAVLGGILPALLWLWYWLREDKLHPEPRSRITIAFLGGMFAAIVALVCEVQFLRGVVAGGGISLLSLVLAIGFIEEGVKYFFAYFTALHTKDADEPIDMIMYLITTALGFAAFENILFVLGTLSQKGATAALIIGNVRFLGATLLHVVASGALGGMLALGFYKAPHIRRYYAIGGFILAFSLHSVYNFFIMPLGGAALIGSPLPVISAVWISVLLLILFFEKVKKIRPDRIART